MGLLKPEYAGGAQAVTAEGGGGFAQFGEATGYAAFANSGGAFFDAAVSNNVEDSHIDEYLERQTEEVCQATMRLNVMERQHELLRAKHGKDSSEPLVKRISKGLSGIPSGPARETTKMPFEKILKLLLASLKGSFMKDLPRQKCASPVPYNSSTAAYHPIFYVSKERKITNKLNSKDDPHAFEGIPVRYQGFTKSIVWFSAENPRWGIVARRMQHQSRMKQKRSKNELPCEENMASKAALFFHVFEGFSYVLIERSSPEEEVNRSKLASYVVHNAAKLVQIWPIFKPNGADGGPAAGAASTAASGAASSPKHLDLEMSAAATLTAAQANRRRRNNGQRPAAGSSSSAAAAAAAAGSDRTERPRGASNSSKKRSFDSNSSDEEHPAFPDSKRVATDDFFSLAFSGGLHLSHDFDFLSSAMPGALPDEQQSLMSGHSAQSPRPEDAVSAASSAASVAAAAAAAAAAAGSAAGGSAGSSGRPLRPLGFDCDSLLEEALLSGEEDYQSRGSDETTLQDTFLEDSDDGFGGSHDPYGVILADSIFKTFCDSMQPSEFAREYERIQSLLFNQSFSQSLRVAIENKDPRVLREFLYPDFATTQFVKGFAVGTLRMTERTVGSADYEVDRCDASGKAILNVDPAGCPNVFDALDKSDMGYVMTRYYWLQSKPSNFWFQRVLSLPNGRQAIVRGYTNIEGSPTTGKQSWSVRFQDVSMLYPDILALPSTSTL